MSISEESLHESLCTLICDWRTAFDTLDALISKSSSNKRMFSDAFIICCECWKKQPYFLDYQQLQYTWWSVVGFMKYRFVLEVFIDLLDYDRTCIYLVSMCLSVSLPIENTNENVSLTLSCVLTFILLLFAVCASSAILASSVFLT